METNVHTDEWGVGLAPIRFSNLKLYELDSNTLSLENLAGGTYKDLKLGQLLAQTAINLVDDKVFSLGTSGDDCFKHVAAGLSANTRDAAPYALIGTPVSQALAANSLIISNVTASGDIAMYANLAGNSQQFLFYDTSASVLYLGVATGYTEILSNTFINDTANTKCTMGLTINQGANDDEILAFKSSDVGHGCTTFTETDTYASFKKETALGGGLFIEAFSDANHTANFPTLAFMSLSGIALDTSKTTTSHGAIEFFAATISGNTYGDATADGNIFAIATRRSSANITVAIFDEDGDLWLNGGITTGGGTPAVDKQFFINPGARTATASTNTAHFWLEPSAALTIPTGTTAIAASMYLAEPNLTATGTVTTAATLYIAGAPTEGSTNWGLYVFATSYLGSNTTINGSLTFPADASSINFGNSTDEYIMGKATDTGVGLVEVCRWAGAADPYFSTGGSQQNKFYNSGIVEIGSSTRNNFGIQATIDTDHSWSGIVVTATAGTNLTIGQICYQGADGKMELADADAAATMPALYMATGTIAEDATGVFLVYGYLRDDTWNWATVGGLLYVDTTTAGAMNQTAPSGTGDQVQVVGHAYSAHIVAFMPSPVLVEVA